MFILKKFTIRLSASASNTRGMVFVSDTFPDVDSLEWCDKFDKTQFQKFTDRKRKTKQQYRPHEPVCYFETSDTTTVSLTKARTAVYVTVKLIPENMQVNVEYMHFHCIHGDHPLGELIDTPAADALKEKLKNELVEAAHNSEYLAGWTRDMDESLVTLVQAIASSLSISPRKLDSAMFTPTADELQKFKNLAGVPLPVIRFRFALVKYLNRLVTPLLHYVDVTSYQEGAEEANLRKMVAGTSSVGIKGVKGEEKKESKEQEENMSLTHIVHQLKALYFMSTKESVFEALLLSEAPTNFKASVTVNRMRASRAREDPSLDPDGLKSIFGQIFTQLRGVPYHRFRVGFNAQVWQTNLVGEGSTDIGGAYRESISNMCADLQSSAVPLFVRCPNGRNDVGLNREKWVINPSATSSLHLAMYEFVGVLLGIAIRTKSALALDFPPLFWKNLLGEDTDVNDLEGVDKLFVQYLNELTSISKGTDGGEADLLSAASFVTQLSDGSETELKKDGSDIKLSPENQKEYVTLSIQVRLRESDMQMHSIRRGLGAVVKLTHLALFSWGDIELLCCGRADMDVQLLRKHTVVSGFSSSAPQIKWLFQALETFSIDQKKAFLRFVWGRDRLPTGESDWDRPFRIHKLSSASNDVLPIAHTCFFSLDLPEYENYETLRKKILYAIENCQAIDIDFVPNASSLTAWVDTE